MAFMRSAELSPDVGREGKVTGAMRPVSRAGCHRANHQVSDIGQAMLSGAHDFKKRVG